jgi:hypothetical protein
LFHDVVAWTSPFVWAPLAGLVALTGYTAYTWSQRGPTRAPIPPQVRSDQVPPYNSEDGCSSDDEGS